MANNPSRPILTAPQIEALTLLADGYTGEQAARKLGIRSNSFSARVTGAIRRLGAKTTCQALLFADRRGLLPGSALSLFTTEGLT